jgi:hypothetical protein
MSQVLAFRTMGEANSDANNRLAEGQPLILNPGQFYSEALLACRNPPPLQFAVTPLHPRHDLQTI